MDGRLRGGELAQPGKLAVDANVYDSIGRTASGGSHAGVGPAECRSFEDAACPGYP